MWGAAESQLHDSQRKNIEEQEDFHKEEKQLTY